MSPLSFNIYIYMNTDDVKQEVNAMVLRKRLLLQNENSGRFGDKPVVICRRYTNSV